MSEDDPAVEEATQEAPEGGPEEAPTDSPAVDWDSDANPYQQRYSDLRPEADRRQAFIDSLNNPATLGRLLQTRDKEAQAEVLRHGGWDTGDGAEDIDTDEPMTRAEFQAWQQSQEQAVAQQTAAQQAIDSDAQAIESDLAAVEKEHGKLSDAELDMLIPLAIQNRDERGAPQFKAAFDQLNSVSQTRHKAYLESKRAPRVSTGTAGTDKVNLADDDQRTQLMAQVMEAEEALGNA